MPSDPTAVGTKRTQHAGGTLGASNALDARTAALTPPPPNPPPPSCGVRALRTRQRAKHRVLLCQRAPGRCLSPFGAPPTGRGGMQARVVGMRLGERKSVNMGGGRRQTAVVPARFDWRGSAQQRNNNSATRMPGELYSTTGRK